MEETNALRFQKSINSTWINTRINKDRIHKVPSLNCNHRLVYVWVWHIQKEIDVTNFTSLSDNIDATLSFQCFWRLSWDSSFCSKRYLWFVESSLSTPLLICVWQTKSIQYCWMLFNSKKSLKCKMLLEDGETRTRRCKTFKCSEMLLDKKMAKLEGDETWPRWSQVPDTTLRAC